MECGLKPLLYGASYSVYVQVVRLTLWAKGVAYEQVPVDVWTEGRSPEHLARHPFGLIPVFDAGEGFIYETAAICRYIDEAYDGPLLQPAAALARARVTQAVAVLDLHGYRPLVRTLYYQRIEAPRRGEPLDQPQIQAARRRARTSLAALERLEPGAPWLAGDVLSLADLHAAPMFNLFTQTPDANELLADCPRLRDWWARARLHLASAQVL